MWLTVILAVGVADFLTVITASGEPGASTATTFERRTDPPPTPRVVRWDRLSTGDCYDNENALAVLRGESTETPQQFTVVSCAKPHQLEVFALIELSGQPSTYPGDETVSRRARARCFVAFQKYVGMPYVESGLDYIFIRPDQANWEEGNRTVTCSAMTPTAARIEGTIRDAEQLDASSEVEPVTIVQWTALEVGDCYDDGSVPAFLDGEEVQPAPIVLLPCDESHHLEVVGTPTIAGQEYPDETEMLETADELCHEALLEYVEYSEETAGLQYFYTYPEEATWEAGVRSLLCSAVHEDYVPFTGSVRAAATA